MNMIYSALLQKKELKAKLSILVSGYLTTKLNFI